MNTQRWTDSLEATTKSFLSLAGELTEDEMNWKPDKDTWGIFQIIDHIIQFNESYYPAIDSLKRSGGSSSWLLKANFITSAIGKMLLKFSSPDRKRKMTTFKIWMPQSEVYTRAILSLFEEQQSELVKRINNSSTLLDDGAVISSPASRMLVYKLETAFDLIVDHERRHLNQAKEMVDHIRSRD